MHKNHAKNCHWSHKLVARSWQIQIIACSHTQPKVQMKQCTWRQAHPLAWSHPSELLCNTVTVVEFTPCSRRRREVTTGCGSAATGCRVVTSGRRVVTSGCRVVTAGCRVVTSGCKAAKNISGGRVVTWGDVKLTQRTRRTWISWKYTRTQHEPFLRIPNGKPGLQGLNPKTPHYNGVRISCVADICHTDDVSAGKCYILLYIPYGSKLHTARNEVQNTNQR